MYPSINRRDSRQGERLRIEIENQLAGAGKVK
jgi:hypothetical protein